MTVAAFLIAVAGFATPQDQPILVTGHTWAPFISPMGEPFRARKPDQDTMADWFHQADRNGDGILTPDEMVADAERFFAILDTNHDGVIDPDELVHYEWEVAPEIQVGSRWRRSASSPAQGAQPTPATQSEGRGKRRRLNPAQDNRGSDGSEYELQGAARYALINMPEPVAAADTNFDRAITLAEFRQAALDRFQILDRSHKGRLTLSDLEALRPPQFVLGTTPKRRQQNEPDRRVGSPLPAGN